MQIRAAFVVVTLLLTSGCDRIERWFGHTAKPASADVTAPNAAPPPQSAPDPAAIAGAAARGEIEAARAFEQALSLRATVSAADCINGPPGAAPISEQTLRTAVESACASRGERDPLLWRLSLLATAPPVRLLPSPPPTELALDAPIYRVRFSGASGIVLVEVGAEYRTVDLVTGEELYRESISTGALGALSDNGRLYFHTGLDQETWVRSAVTGERLFALPGARAASEASWTSVDAIVYGEDWGARVLDLIWDRKFEIRNQRHPRAIPAPLHRLGPREFIVLGPDRILQLSLPNSSGSTKAFETVTDWTIERRAWTGWDGLTLDGRYFVDGAPFLTVFDFHRNEKEEFSFAPFHLEAAFPALEPQELFVQMYPFGHVEQRKLYVFHMKDKTLAEVDSKAVPVNRLVMARPFKQMAAVMDNRLVFLRSIPRGRMEPFEVVVANVEKALTAAEPKAIAGRPLGVAAMPGPLVEVAKNAFVEAVGIYSAGVDRAGTYNGMVRVEVRRSSKPLVLVLSAYSDTTWQLILEPGAQIAAILKSGYQRQTVIGAGGARVVDLGRTFVYERDKLPELEREVFQVTGRRIDVFQGRYEGNRFSVGGL